MSSSAALWLSVVLGSCAQVFLKRGVSPQGAAGAPRSSLALLRSLWVWAWAACFVVATGLWLIAISRIEVSYAFPMLSIGYPIVAVLSIFFLQEKVTLSRWTAIGVISLGVAIIYGSS